MRKRWNILIITLFLLFIISFLWILITKYIRNILYYSWEFEKHYKSYYLAYWWVEIALTKIKNHWYWFEEKLEKTSKTVVSNLNACEWDCNFSYDIISKTNHITDKENFDEISTCSDEDSFGLEAWQSIVIPLFTDRSVWEAGIDDIVYTKYSYTDFRNIVLDVYHMNNKKFLVWVAIIDNPIKNYVTKIWNTDNFSLPFNTTDLNSLQYSNNKLSFLVVSNIEDNSQTKYFCLNSIKKLYSGYIKIKSIWNYHWKSIWLNAILKRPLPEYLVYSIIE